MLFEKTTPLPRPYQNKITVLSVNTFIEWHKYNVRNQLLEVRVIKK